jgi:hypothetical protein
MFALTSLTQLTKISRPQKLNNDISLQNGQIVVLWQIVYLKNYHIYLPGTNKKELSVQIKFHIYIILIKLMPNFWLICLLGKVKF